MELKMELGIGLSSASLGPALSTIYPDTYLLSFSSLPELKVVVADLDAAQHCCVRPRGLGCILL
jgi:hypothetical protein